VTLAIVFAVGYYHSPAAFDAKQILWAGVAAAGALYFPAALIRVFLPRAQRPFLIYIGVQAALALLVPFGALVDAYHGGDFRVAIAMIPTCGLLLLGSVEDGDILRVLLGNGLITAASLCFLLFKMREPWRKTRTLEKAAAVLPSASTIDGAERATAK
jgi:hypothetical protein